MESRTELQDLYAVEQEQTLIQGKQPQPLLETPKIVERLTNGDKF
jgi:hypothetical protein